MPSEDRPPAPSLFLVVLGGRAVGAHIELHDVRFVAGYRVELRQEPFAGPERLWFVTLGGYDPAQLAELHAFGLFVASSPAGAKGERWWVHLIPDSRSQNQVPDWLGYRPI
jgi:hypothetical protein